MPKVYGFASEQDRDLFHGDVVKLASAHSASIKLAKVGDRAGLLEVGESMKDIFVERLVTQKYANYVEKVAWFGSVRRLFGGAKTPKVLRPNSSPLELAASKFNPIRPLNPFLPRQVTGGSWGGYDNALAPTFTGTHSSHVLSRFRNETGNAPFTKAKTPEELRSAFEGELSTVNPRHGHVPAQYAKDFTDSLSPWYKLKAVVPHAFSGPQDALMYARSQALAAGNKELFDSLSRRLSGIDTAKTIGRVGILGTAAAVPAYQRGRQERQTRGSGLLSSYANTVGGAVGQVAPNVGGMIKDNPQLAALLSGGAGLALLYMLLSNRGQR